MIADHGLPPSRPIACELVAVLEQLGERAADRVEGQDRQCQHEAGQHRIGRRLVEIVDLPVRSISPQLGVGGGMPTPRKASAASSRIATEDSTTICTSDRAPGHWAGSVRNML